ncbi:hypothetical protein QBC38DRAFT_518666 [Podospora fimiseda]|uniref:WW domain-containing protein n=1 Tax=Podospora fimiseda TaxID=252190 RepID=A0AAN6YTA5_9PEZI|nr:hypothetical protein QBC38DRAFT_518666 [Podospora fimiseda]
MSSSTHTHTPLPTYAEALNTTTASDRPCSRIPRNGIPLQARRSMEDELRPVPTGWVREFDPETQHQFFVDTNSSPPRAIWHHPHDDEEYLSSLSPDDLKLIITHSSSTTWNPRRPSHADMEAESTDEEQQSDSSTSSKTRKLARKIKDALTGKSHDERALDRANRATTEREMYRQHRILRRGMASAMNTGRPQFLGKDENRTHMFLEPPGHTFPMVKEVKKMSPYMSEVVYDDSQRGTDRPKGRFMRPEGEMYGFGYGGYGCGKFAGGRWEKPKGECKRREGWGFGGGIGWPMAMPVLGGIAMGGLGGICM